MAHVENNSGNIEWYTPPHLIEAARNTMGSIDCDPCSCELAQRYIRAATYYTKATNGLDKQWHGNVWFQPPYQRRLIQAFVRALSNQIGAGYCKQFTGLTNNGTEQKQGKSYSSYLTPPVFLLAGLCSLIKTGQNPTSHYKGKSFGIEGQILNDSRKNTPK